MMEFTHVTDAAHNPLTIKNFLKSLRIQGQRGDSTLQPQASPMKTPPKPPRKKASGRRAQRPEALRTTSPGVRSRDWGMTDFVGV